MKQLFRHINTTHSLTGFARRAVILLAVLCYVGGTWGQTLVRKGTINEGDETLYYQMLAECPVDITSQLGALTTWTGVNIIHGGDKHGEHWDGSADNTYSENQNGWNDNSWSASMTKTITLSKGKYLFIGPGRSQQNVEAYFKVGNLSARVHNGGNTGLGINIEGQPSFSSGTFANNGNGRGWRYTYIQFDVAYESNVTFKIDANATGRQQFMSFTDPKLYKLSENLSTDMYMAWDGVGGNASATGNTGCENNFNSSANNIYGDASVSNTHYADLTDYSTLELTFSDGTPRLLFNRQTTDNNNDNNSNWLEINSANPINGIQYVTVDGNRWIIDLDKVANDRNLGYVHLNSIKGANWGNVTITSATLSGPSLRSLFHQWDGTGAGSSVTAVNPENFVWHNGEEVAAGGVIYGDNSGWVPQNQYADLTPYDKLVVTYDNSKQYPRFMFNKAGDNTFVVEVNGQNSEYVSVSGNQITINLAKLRNDNGGYVHLNGIKASNDGTTTISAINLLSFNPSPNINQRVEKTFNISDGNVLFQNPRMFTVQFNFDDWKLYLYDSDNQVVAEQVLVPNNNGDDNGSGPDGYWWKNDSFYGHTLHLGNGSNPINYFYVRWYLKDKSGNVKNIDNSLINSIYRQTVSSQDGLVWSSRAGDGITDLHTILRMTVDGTPDGGEPFNLLNYDLVCAISDAGNERVINNTAASDPSPINIEYTFHFAMEKYSLTGKKVTHKISYLKQYADQSSELGLDLESQGLTTDAQSDWWNYGKETQKVNQFEITHYVKKGESEKYLLPTAQNTNDHTMYQRWYNYNNETDLQGIQSHVTLNGNGGSVPYYIYQNGLVTGDRVYWGENRSFLSNGQTPYAYTTFTYQNVDGDSLTVAADVSRYSDMTYEYPSDPLSGDLKEPSLTMRYIYYMKDAREMAAKLTEKDFKGDWSSTQYEAVNDQNRANTNEDNWLEKKVFHFPSRQLAYEKDKAVGYRGEFIALRHRFSDYWIFNSSTPSYNSEHPTDDNLNDHLVHGSTYGSIVVKIFDPNGTGIRLGGYNPSINLKSGTTAAMPAAQVGDKIRVNTSNRNNAYFGNLFKHVDDYSNWGELITSQSIQSNYVETTIPSQQVLDELQQKGLRFQGTNFTLTSVELISGSTGNSRILPLNQSTPVVFDDSWGQAPTIAASEFTTSTAADYNEGNDVDYLGYYYHDKMYPWGDVDEYGSSRFLVFRYPESGKVTATNKEVYLRAYFVDPTNTSRRFQLAQYTLIFDEGAYGDGCATLPLKSVNGGTNVKVSGSEDQYSRMDYVEGTPRDPRQLRAKAGKPIAQITFDYPEGSTYHFPVGAATNHGQNRHEGESYGYENNQPYIYPDDDHPLFEGIIPDSSPIPLNFDKSNYAFDGENALFGAYAMLGGMSTRWGNQKACLPADDATYGYNLPADDGYDAGFLYIDASELPGDICSTPFVGDFCAGDHLMVSGWISGANNVKNGTGVPGDGGGDGVRSPGGITLTLKGEHTVNGEKKTETLYRFCPGMCYELDNGSGLDGNGGDHVVWQQFYFDFHVQEKYERHWLEVNNNCVSSQGGDFMLDNIEVYCIVPEVEPTINTPLCISVGEDGETVTDMRLLKLTVNYNKLMSSRELESDGTCEEGFVFLDKYKFLESFKEELIKDYPEVYHGFNFNSISLDELALALEEGSLDGLPVVEGSAYKIAFDKAILGEKSTWHSDRPTENMGASIMFFRWNSDYNAMEEFSYERAANKKKSVFREEIDGEKFVVMNGNYPGLRFRTNTDYYIINTGEGYTSPEGSLANPCPYFNLCSPCCRVSTFKIEPPLEVVGLDAAENMEDLVVCDGQVPTLLTNLKGYDIKGNEIKMKNLNFDWWLGNKTATEPEDRLATLDNYHAQYKLIDESLGDVDGNRIYLAYALSVMRAYYPGITSLDGITKQTETPNLKDYMIKYLREVVDAGELLLHQSAISVPAELVLDSDPYFYLVACPIHDEAFIQALNPSASEYVAFYCDEPQGVRIKLGQKAPRLQTGFVPGEHGFASYNYDFPANTNPVLSIRLAKAAQFETVKEPTKATDGTIREDVNYLWLPIRNAQTEGAGGVIKKSEDDNVYLAASNDLTWDKKISTEMNKNGSLPVVGRIVQLTAINTKDNSEGALPGATIAADENANNRLSIYFTYDFNVREGYNYTLSLPFQEDLDADGNSQNSCDGTILINLKIVPDYEVWTGAAGNTDWNNDENWRRADGNTGSNLQYDVYGDELYRANGAANNPNSPLYKYTTNKDNYYSSATSKRKPTVNPKPSSDQVLRKGFAPLYCTHILMSRDEWGNAPILYDALDNQATLTASPFPNLRETSTPILKFDMQARRYDMWKDTYGVDPDRGVSTRTNDLIAEMYQINSCDEIAMQPGTELRNSHLLNYNNAWMEFELDAKRWYLLGSPLQGTISGEWYAPTGTDATGNAPLQKTTYYDDVKFGAGYDRYSPAIYQRSWDKAKAVLYEVGSTYDKDDDKQDENLGNDDEGIWSGTGNSATWAVEGGGSADQYLDRLGYKPMGGNKANVAIKGIWSNTYNDAQVDYSKGGFSVMVMNHLKGKPADVKAIVRLPKEDTMYDYYEYSQNGAADGGTDTDLSTVQSEKNRALNRGRLKTDLLLPEIKDAQQNLIIQKTEKTASRYGDQRTITRIPIKEDVLTAMNTTFVPQNGNPATAGFFTETVSAGISNLGYYLVENPFTCGLDMAKFFAANSVNFTQEEITNASEDDPAYGKTTNDVKEGLLKKYWLLTKAADGQNPRQVLVQQAPDGEWITSDGTNFGTAIEYPDPVDNTQTLEFYPNAVLAPGQGFFVQAKSGISGDLTVTFNRDMQVQSRFGVIDGEGTTYKIVVGQAQATKKMYDAPDSDGNYDGIPDGDLPADVADNYEAGDTYMVGDVETIVYVENIYEDIEDPDNPGQTIKVPVLLDLEEDVVIYNYVPETLTITPDDPSTPDNESVTVDKQYPLKSRTRSTVVTSLPGLVITAQRDDSETSALVMQRGGASNDFLPEEDTEVFINSDFENAPTVYTLCGRLATTINSIHDFRSLPIGVESSSDAPCTLTFRGVEMLGDSISFYDAVEQKLTPLESGMTFKVSGQTQNRYYLVRSLNKKDAAEETHLQIFTEGLKAKVIASTAEPITVVRCFDTGGRLIYTASPQLPEYSFDLPRAGVYIIEAETEHDRKTRKVIVK